MPDVYGFSGKDVGRIGRAVRENESAPARLPLAGGSHIPTSARVVAFEVVSEEADSEGLWEIEILELDLAGGAPWDVIKRSPTYKVHLLELNS